MAAVAFGGTGGGEPPSPWQASFHPDSAAASFGSATAIADFDADGAPDVAIADRTAGHSGSHYRIDVRLSRGTVQSVSFVSTSGALNVEAVDVDDDHDEDLVVTPVLSREVVGVWLNDGTGHFYRSEVSGISLPATRLSALILNNLPDRLQAVTSGGRPLDDVAPPAATLIVGRRTRDAGITVFAVREAILPGASPRGPPLAHS